MTSRHIGTTHIFESRDGSNTINLKAGDGQNLVVYGTLSGGAGAIPGGVVGAVQVNGGGGELEGLNTFTHSLGEMTLSDKLNISNTTEANGTTGALSVQGGINLEKKMTMGANSKIVFHAGTQADFRVDASDEGGGWVDLTTVPVARTTGANAPAYSVWRGNMRGYEFDTGAFKELFYEQHIPHNYDIETNSGIYFHAHFTNNTAVPAGAVKLNWEYTYANSSSTFPTTATVSAVVDVSSQYSHQILEIATPVLAGQLEVDGIISVRLYRDASDPADTFNGSIFILQLDSHIQVSKWSTKHKDKTTGSFYV